MTGDACNLSEIYFRVLIGMHNFSNISWSVTGIPQRNGHLWVLSMPEMSDLFRVFRSRMSCCMWNTWRSPCSRIMALSTTALSLLSGKGSILDLKWCPSIHLSGSKWTGNMGLVVCSLELHSCLQWMFLPFCRVYGTNVEDDDTDEAADTDSHDVPPEEEILENSGKYHWHSNPSISPSRF